MIMHLKKNDVNYESYELQQCSLPNWYKKFEKISIESFILNIPNDILNYLKDEIIILPKECYSKSNQTSTKSDFDILESSESEDEDEILEPEFPEFSSKITQIIEKFSQKNCFLKTNWHCPKDAFWITAGQTLKVKDITDVYQLLKASSIVKNDLNNHDLPLLVENNASAAASTSESTDYYLIFKKWLEIHPGSEFRCFVKQNKLIAISPRDWPQYHKHIGEQKLEIISDIVSIFNEKIRNKFELENYCFDVIRDRKDHVILVDFSPFNTKFTDALAFEWNELENDETFCGDHPEFRYLTENCFIQPNRRNNYGYPQDIVDVFQRNNLSENGTIAELLSNRVRDEMNLQTDSEN